MSLSRLLVGILQPLLALLLLAGVPARGGQWLDAAGIVRPDEAKGGAFILAQIGATTDEERQSGMDPAAGNDTPDPHAIAAVLVASGLAPSYSSAPVDLDRDAPVGGVRPRANLATGPPASV